LVLKFFNTLFPHSLHQAILSSFRMPMPTGNQAPAQQAFGSIWRGNEKIVSAQRGRRATAGFLDVHLLARLNCCV
jgi:hypothetical protein